MSWDRGLTIGSLGIPGMGGTVSGAGGDIVIDMNAVGAYGGTWTRGGGYAPFVNELEAFYAGADYVDRHNGWSSTASGSYTGYAKAYTAATGTAVPMMLLPSVSIEALRANPKLPEVMAAALFSGVPWGDVMQFADKHFNGGLGTVSAAIEGYQKLPNGMKRAYAYKLSKVIDVKSGRIFQGAKSVTNTVDKVAGKLSPYGTVLGASIIGYEYLSGTWDAHTVVNAGLLVATGAATVFGAPVVLTGIAMYGVADYFFDIGGALDRNIGRKADIWKP